jgi:hypothetical protein
MAFGYPGPTFYPSHRVALGDNCSTEAIGSAQRGPLS